MSTNLTPEENTCMYWIGGREGKTASLDSVEKRNILCPYQHSKIWQTIEGQFPNWLYYPSSYNNHYILNYQLQEFSITLHIGSNQEALKTDMNHNTSTNCYSQPGNIIILAHCLKEYGFKTYNLELPSKEAMFHVHLVITHDCRFLFKFYASELPCTRHQQHIPTHVTYKLPKSV